MSLKPKVSGEEKIAAIEKYLRGEDSLHHLAVLLGVRHHTVQQWLRNYQSLGPNGLLDTSKRTAYSSELKIAAVKDYLDGYGSLLDICKKYGIKSNRQLRHWIMKYNGHEELKAPRTGGLPIMIKGRATTYDERVEIVKYCVEHQNNYQETADKFQVSYQQVYAWVNKYLKNGLEPLQDRRGKRKSEDEMSEIEKLKAQNKLLEAEIRKKQIEIDLLKKLKEIERRGF